MEHTAHLAGKRLELGESVVKGVALVDHAVQTGFAGDFQLLLENFSLFLFVTRVIGSGVWSAGLRPGAFRGVAFSRRFGDRSAGPAVIIQADFTDGDDFWMLRQFAQRFANIVRGFMGV